MAAWPELLQAIHDGILAMVKAASGEGENQVRVCDLPSVESWLFNSRSKFSSSSEHPFPSDSLSWYVLMKATISILRDQHSLAIATSRYEEPRNFIRVEKA